VVAHGITFPSKKEALRYQNLLALQRIGEISELTYQPKFLIVERCWNPLTGRWMPARMYIADFQYKRGEDVVVEDVKGFRTPMYRLKLHLFLLRYGHQYTFLET